MQLKSERMVESASEAVEKLLQSPSSVMKSAEQKEAVVIRFAGDSGDGMQLTGSLSTLCWATTVEE